MAKTKQQLKQRRKQQVKNKRKRAAPKSTLVVGDYVDALDEVGVWNVAQIVEALTDDSVRVRFQGYGEREDEVLSTDGDRVAPYHTYTWTVKCWAKYLNWPMWPALLTVLAPATARGVGCLRRMEVLFVDFMDAPSFDERTRCWVAKTDVQPFESKYKQCRKRTTGSCFENALKCVLLSSAAARMPAFTRKRVLPKIYKASCTTPRPEMQKDLGRSLVAQQFASTTTRYEDKFVFSSEAQIKYEDASAPSIRCERVPAAYLLRADSESDSDVSRKRKRSRKLPARPATMSTTQRRDRFGRERAAKELDDGRAPFVLQLLSESSTTARAATLFSDDNDDDEQLPCSATDSKAPHPTRSTEDPAAPSPKKYRARSTQLSRFRSGLEVAPLQFESKKHGHASTIESRAAEPNELLSAESTATEDTTVVAAAGDGVLHERVGLPAIAMVKDLAIEVLAPSTYSFLEQEEQ